MTLLEKISDLRKVITVEPIVIVFTLVVYTSNQIRHTFYTEYLNHEVSSWGNSSHSVFLKVASLAPMVVVLSSYSDHHGLRKPLLLLPLFGEFIMTTTLFVCTRQKHICTNNGFNVVKMISESFGGVVLLFLMSNTYLADVTHHSTRTFRFGVLQLVFLSFLPGFDWLRALWPGEEEPNLDVRILTNGSLLLAAILYGIFWLEGSKGPNMREFLDLFNPRHFLYTFKMLTSQRPENGRKSLWVLFGLVFVNGITIIIDICFAQHFEQFKRGDWKYSSLSFPFLTVFILVIFVKLLKLSDLVLLLIGLISLALGNLFLGVWFYSHNAMILTTGQVVHTLGVVLTIAVCISTLTKKVSKDEYGKIIGLFCLCHVFLVFLLLIIVYFNGNLYHSVCFFSLAALSFTLGCVALWSTSRSKRLTREQEAQTVVENNVNNCTTSTV